MMLGMLCLLKADDGPTFLFETCDSSSQKATELLSSTLALVLFVDEHNRCALAFAEGMVGWIVKNRIIPCREASG